MKLRILLGISMLLVPFAIMAQSTATNVKFYSTGKMYVGENKAHADSAALFIDGSAKFGKKADTIAATQIEQVGITKLTGDFIDALATKEGVKVDTLFTKASNAKGVIWFAGKDVVQTIIRDSLVYKNDAVGRNYINFPTLRVNQAISAPVTGKEKMEIGYVAVDTASAISIHNLEIGGVKNYRGAFAINSAYVRNRPSALKTGYALINQINSGAPATSNGLSRVNLKLNDGTPATVKPSTSVDATTKYLTGFAAPFEEMGTDYMFYQVIFEPNGSDLTSNKGPILDPEFKMYPGKGYFIALEVSDFDQGTIGSAHGVAYADRYKDGYVLSRDLLKYYSNTANVGVATSGYKKENFHQASNANVKEYFKTDDVTVSLKEGLNFLGNPFMAPLDLGPIVDASQGPGRDSVDYTVDNFAVIVSDMGVESSLKVSRKLQLNKSIREKYWVIKDGIITYEDRTSTWWGPYYHYKVGSYTAQVGGATAGELTEDGNATTNLIPPLGIFAIQASGDFNIKIKRPTAKTLSSHVYSRKNSNSSVVDDILIQAQNLDNGLEDRLAIMFRNQKIGGTDYVYMNSVKNFSKKIENSEQFSMMEGSIFTKAANGNPMLANAVSKNIKQMAMYIVPPVGDTPNRILIKPYRMSSLQSIHKIWIEDRATGNVSELTPEGKEYLIEPVSQAVNLSELENRFVLYFNELPSTNGNGGEGEIDPISVYYDGANLRITGLNDDDINSRVDIYDLQGRIVAKTTINETPEKNYSKSFAQGTYIVKITGKRNYTSKFISLQNK